MKDINEKKDIAVGIPDDKEKVSGGVYAFANPDNPKDFIYVMYKDYKEGLTFYDYQHLLSQGKLNIEVTDYSKGGVYDAETGKRVWFNHPVVD